MRVRFVSIAFASAFAVACSQTPTEVLDATAARLSDIRSGEMSLDASITSGEDARVGFTLEGVFSLPTEEGALPEADLAYTQLDGETTTSGRFVSDGDTVIVEVDGNAVELSDEQIDELRVSGNDSDTSVFADAGIGQWIDNAEVSDDGDTQTITGDLDVVTALNDIVDIAARFGALGLQHIDEQSKEQVENAVESSSISITTGTEDRLLRALEVHIDFAVPDEELADALGELAGATFDLTLEIDEPNREVAVE